MKFFRYRRPSLNTLLGITKAKKKLRKDLGITAALKPFRFWGNLVRRAKRQTGYESHVGRLLRNGLPRPGGCLLVVIAVTLSIAIFVVSVSLYLEIKVSQPKLQGIPFDTNSTMLNTESFLDQFVPM